MKAYNVTVDTHATAQLAVAANDSADAIRQVKRKLAEGDDLVFEVDLLDPDDADYFAVPLPAAEPPKREDQLMVLVRALRRPDATDAEAATVLREFVEQLMDGLV